MSHASPCSCSHAIGPFRGVDTISQSSTYKWKARTQDQHFTESGSRELAERDVSTTRDETSALSREIKDRMRTSSFHRVFQMGCRGGPRASDLGYSWCSSTAVPPLVVYTKYIKSRQGLKPERTYLRNSNFQQSHPLSAYPARHQITPWQCHDSSAESH